MHDTTSPANRQQHRLLRWCSAAALLLLATQAFKWNIFDALPLLGLLLVVPPWMFALVMTMWSGSVAWERRSEGWPVAAPLVVSGGALVLAATLPLTQWWLHVNFNLYKDARESIVTQVNIGAVYPNVSHNDSLIALSDAPPVSMGGNEIVIDGQPGRHHVLFYTFRGFMGSYSGFLWVPDGATPQQFWGADDPETEIVPYGGNWYYIAHP